MSVYLSEAIARRAEENQRAHGPDETGLWCGFCLRHHRLRVRVSECDSYVRAGLLIEAYVQQLERRRPGGVPRLQFSRPARPRD